MEPELDYCKVFCCGNPEEKKANIPVECSIVLPDYFPDVMKILRYTAKTVKSPVFSESGGETVSGNINMEVSYISEEGELCSCSQLKSFSHTFESEGKIAAAEARVFVGEIGCRAVSKRRIDLHGNVEIILETLSGEEKDFVSSAKGAGAVCKTETSDEIIFVGEYYKSFTVEEKAELGFEKPPFGKLVRSSASAEVTECHVIQDKIVTKGEVRINLLWLPEESGENPEKGPFRTELSFPISRMADAEGILLTDICDAGYEADFPEITPSEDGKNVFVKIKIGIFSRVYRKKNINYVSDMFSKDFESTEERSEISITNKAVPVAVTEPFFEKIDLPESAEAVDDIWIEIGNPEIARKEKILLPIKICMFAKDEDENPVYFEKNSEKEIVFSGESENIIFKSLSAKVKNEEFSVSSEGKAEVSAALVVDGTVYYSVTANVISGCSVNTEKKTGAGTVPLVFYFAEKGENIWDIAKRYRASEKNIMAENGLSENVLSERKMIVITK